MGFKWIFFSVWILLQIIGFYCAKFLIWQFHIKNKIITKLLYLFIFLLINGSMVASFLRLFKDVFRYNAILMVILWFTFLVGIGVWILKKILFKIKYKKLLKNQSDKYNQLNINNQTQEVLKIDNLLNFQLNASLRKIAPIMWLGLIGLAWFNAYVPTVKYLSIQIDKPLAKSIRVGMAADLHLGVLVGKRQLNKLADIFNHNEVEMILLAGDIMDDNTVAYEAENMRPELEQIRAPLGVFATLGNHDLFGAEKQITKAMEDAGIRVLNDEADFVGNRVWVVGRPDNLDKNRLTTQDLLKKANTNQPVILIDHRPDSIGIHQNLPIDLQVSGHVHNGQIFPGNLVVKFLNEVSYGYKLLNNKHFVVTSGFGFWGIPFRLGSQSEVWIIDIHGKNS